MHLAKRLRRPLGRFCSILGMLAVAVGVTASHDAAALPLTLTFNGVATNSSFGSPPSWSVGGGVVGTPVSVTYTFETSTPNTLLPANPVTAWYQNSISSMTVVAGGTTSTYIPTSSKITVVDNAAPTLDQYRLEANGAGNTSLVKLDLLDFAGLALGSTALPTTLNLADYQTPTGRIEGPGGFFSPVLYFDITSVSVPEPASLSALGVLAIAGRRRRPV